MKNVLYCPKCKKELIQVDNALKCINNHSYDISKKGFVNLLLANQHHGENSGDEKGMILSRVRFLNTGKYNILRDLITETIKNLIIDNSLSKAIIGDFGCGEGYYTTFFHEELSKFCDVSTYGIDLSKQAIIECCKRKREKQIKDIKFIVGNLNYLPIMSSSLDFIVNSFAKIDENEFLRVLRSGGYFLRILPGKNHLLGLKSVLYENVRLNEDKEIELPGFDFVKEEFSECEIELNNQEINDLFTMTPYYYKSPKDSSLKLRSLEKLQTKISFKILIYKKR